MTAHSAVADGKLTNEELGSFTRPCDEIKRRLNEGTITLPFVMNGLQSIIEGSPVPTTQDVIDLDADPVVPNCRNVEEHQGSWIEGTKLREELRAYNPSNANLLDYLLKHPHLIPEEWSSKYVFFWGTLYRNSVGNLYVRCLCWGRNRWEAGRV
jgi:hypothetical protein